MYGCGVLMVGQDEGGLPHIIPKEMPEFITGQQASNPLKGLHKLYTKESPSGSDAI
jgi:hypothetical protein